MLMGICSTVIYLCVNIYLDGTVSKWDGSYNFNESFKLS